MRIVHAIHDAAGEDFPVSLRYSVVSRTKGFREGRSRRDYVEVGRTMEESEWAARYLTDEGYAMLNCDNGTYDAGTGLTRPSTCPRTATFPADVEHIKDAWTCRLCLCRPHGPLCGRTGRGRGQA